ncbi:MAG: hypothetical protein HQM02_06315, partial [Magnetococcales bacterium]|nr:hypothetical protein [Magnetococcales bacterium]
MSRFDDRTVALGTLEVASTLEEIFVRLRERGMIILLTQATQIFLVFFFVLFLLHILVGRRLRRMAGYAQLVQLQHLENLEPLAHRQVTNSALDELDHLAMALNHMVGELRDSYLQSQAAASSIQKERD